MKTANRFFQLVFLGAILTIICTVTCFAASPSYLPTREWIDANNAHTRLLKEGANLPDDLLKQLTGQWNAINELHDGYVNGTNPLSKEVEASLQKNEALEARVRAAQSLTPAQVASLKAEVAEFNLYLDQDLNPRAEKKTAEVDGKYSTFAKDVAAVFDQRLTQHNDSCSEIKQQLARDQEAMHRQQKSIEQGQAELLEWTKKNGEAQKATLKRATSFLVDSLAGKLGEFTEGKLAKLEANFKKRAPLGETLAAEDPEGPGIPRGGDAPYGRHRRNQDCWIHGSCGRRLAGGQGVGCEKRERRGDTRRDLS